MERLFIADNWIIIRIYTGTRYYRVFISIYITKVWDISCFCIDVPNESKPIQEMPPNVSSWRGHTDAVISIDTAEHKELIVSASLDCCVSLWTVCGRYVGKDMGTDNY